jgi:hypothetical protein
MGKRIDMGICVREGIGRCRRLNSDVANRFSRATHDRYEYQWRAIDASRSNNYPEPGVRDMRDIEDQEFIKSMKDAAARSEQHYAETMKNGAYVQKLIAKAAKQAANNAINDGIRPVLDVPGRAFKYEVQQGLRAACVGREDAAATLMLMSPVLETLQTIKRLIWVILAVLIYIAYRVSGVGL